MATIRISPAALAPAMVVFGSLLLAALPAAAQTRITPGPNYATPPSIATPQPGTTPRGAYQPSPSAGQNEINPYFRKQGQGANQASPQSPLYQPYQPNAQVDPFRPPSSMQGTGGTSAYQQKTQNPPALRECDAFNRIGDTYAACKSAQAKQAYQNQQLKAQQPAR